MNLNGGDPCTYKSKATYEMFFLEILDIIFLEIHDDGNSSNHQHGLSSSSSASNNGNMSNTNSFTNQTNSSTSYNYSSSNKTDSYNRSSNDRGQSS